MLEPKKRKYRKEFRGKMAGVATANREISFGDYGIKAAKCGWINARQIEAARRAMAGYTKRKGRIWTKIFPHKPYTAKPTNSKMINGKGDIEGYVAVVKPGTILFEIGGVDRDIAKEALRLASHKLSLKTKFVERKQM